MKKTFIFLVFLSTIGFYAQAPQGFNYQSIVRNSSGDLLVNQDVNYKFNFMLNSPTSQIIYTETHTVQTDDIGHVNLVIGSGTSSLGDFSNIDWGTGNYYLGIELNTGSGFLVMGTTQLLSVPYALYANSAGSVNFLGLSEILLINNSADNSQISDLLDPTNPQDAVTLSFLMQQINSLQSQIDILENLITFPLPSINIGNQVWQSVNHTGVTYRDGTPIPQVTDPSEWIGLTTGAWCYYNNDPLNEDVYGKLYNWYAIAGIHDQASFDNVSLRKEFAPIGWHVASNQEWNILSDFLGGASESGGKLKESGTTHWQSPNVDATNLSGFTALPGGKRNSSSGAFQNINTVGYWWNMDEYTIANQWGDEESCALFNNLQSNHGLYYGGSYQPKKEAQSVRLLKN